MRGYERLVEENLGRTGACCKVILRWDVALGWVMGEEAELRTWRNLVLQMARNYLKFLSKGLS